MGRVMGLVRLFLGVWGVGARLRVFRFICIVWGLRRGVRGGLRILWRVTRGGVDGEGWEGGVLRDEEARIEGLLDRVSARSGTCRAIAK